MLLDGYMRVQLDNKASLSSHLIPRYNLGCKRVLLSDDYLPGFKKKKKIGI